MAIGAVPLLVMTVSLLMASAHGKSVLYLSYPLRSHYGYGVTVGRQLQKLGHDVTIAVNAADDTLPLLRESGLRMLVYHTLDDVTDNVGQMSIHPEMDIYFNDAPKSTFFEFKRKVCELLLKDQDFLRDIRDAKPDLILLDSTPLPRMLAVIPYKLDVPFAFIGVGYNPQWARIPLLPSVVPEMLSSYSDSMTFQERLSNAVTSYVSYFYDPWSFRSTVAMFAPEKPYMTLQELHARAELWLVEEEPVLDYPKPTMPNVKVIGSLSDVSPKPLPQPVQAFVDNAVEGVVLASFGSVSTNLPRYVIDNFMAAFRETKFKVIFKSGMKNPNPKKMLLLDWLPQYDILRHPNVKVFVSHCGANSQSEAVLAEVPTICFPFFAEQPYNAARMTAKGLSIVMSMKTFSPDDLVANLEAVADNATMKARLRKAADIMRARTTSPAEEAAFWLDHVMKFGADHLRSRGVFLPLYQYLSLDVLALVLAVFHALLVAMFFICRGVIRFLFGNGQGRKVKKE